MEEASDFRHWDELIPDALGLIIKKLTLQEILTVIPMVCKSWSKAVQGPYCWQEIDVYEWSTQCQAHQLDRMLQLLITRSCGSLRKLHVSCVNNDQMFSFIAEHANSLQTLILRRSEISDSIVTQVARKLSTISFLDLSYCRQIGTQALEAIGKNCKSLVALSWNMHPIDIEDRPSHIEEAHAIANTMPKLKQLELAYLHMNTASVIEILSRCPDLETLDLRGCWNVKLDKKFLEEKHPKVRVLGPHVVMGYLERGYLDDCSDFSDDYWMDYSDDDFFDNYSYSNGGDGEDDNEEESFDEVWNGDELLQLRFYGGTAEDLQAFGWPPSP
ncbi:hypothetical protein Nepgr_002007 [Nepenthes gracilis]|uniref:F-box domain-containing protein n=1 Tax=Nepenthes gracilis TaxID=150966 RepID=A0AAD3RY13_NEPGR|nr:hypothetical protein Nepgr_002007 [Nepenthes gracilis]